MTTSISDRRETKIVDVRTDESGTNRLAVDTDEANFTTHYDFYTTAIFIGNAAIGTATGSALWQIKKFTLSSGNPTKKEWADSDENFDNIWDDRLTLTYG